GRAMLTTVTSTAMKNCNMDIAHSTSHARTADEPGRPPEEGMPGSIRCSVAQRWLRAARTCRSGRITKRLDVQEEKCDCERPAASGRSRSLRHRRPRSTKQTCGGRYQEGSGALPVFPGPRGPALRQGTDATDRIRTGVLAVLETARDNLCATATPGANPSRARVRTAPALGPGPATLAVAGEDVPEAGQVRFLLLLVLVPAALVAKRHERLRVEALAEAVDLQAVVEAGLAEEVQDLLPAVLRHPVGNVPARAVVPEHPTRVMDRPLRLRVGEVQRLVVLRAVAEQGDKRLGDALEEGLLEGEVLLRIQIQVRLVVERQQQRAAVLREVPDRGLTSPVVPGQA